ncbi:hypothetical protein B9Z55_008612 [Caenorhabditis nigoni]|uniref:Uncharacterized protein n=1 Tax=Caenorhabditis nigoni TaxID=1611254 RepID=A0A2G5UNC2_9PELO|nr:hypothetical protein B9Z55_008612 [Caenorhabditis nigoni]
MNESITLLKLFQSSFKCSKKVPSLLELSKNVQDFTVGDNQLEGAPLDEITEQVIEDMVREWQLSHFRN